MRTRELGAAIMLLAGCGNTTTKTEYPTAKIQPWVDKCFKYQPQEADCWQFCQAAFEIPEGDEVKSCLMEKEGDHIKVTMVTGKRKEPFRLGGADGRRPLGLHEDAIAPTAGAYLAWCAQMEAASVTAFERLLAHLTTDGAPAELLASCREARADEIAHAAAVVPLALRHGGTPVAPTIDPEPEIGDIDRAIDNVVEGCVGETVAALRAAMLAQHARDPDVRAAYATIADDEIRHAALAFELDVYYRARLSPTEIARVDEAHAAAVARALEDDVHPGLIELGLSAPMLRAAVRDLLALPVTQLAA